MSVIPQIQNFSIHIDTIGPYPTLVKFQNLVVIDVPLCTAYHYVPSDSKVKFEIA